MGRFPRDFMFQLTKDEWNKLIKIVDKFPDKIRHYPLLPLVFTETRCRNAFQRFTAQEGNIGHIAISGPLWTSACWLIQQRNWLNGSDLIEATYDQKSAGFWSNSRTDRRPFKTSQWKKSVIKFPGRVKMFVYLTVLFQWNFLETIISL